MIAAATESVDWPKSDIVFEGQSRFLSYKNNVIMILLDFEAAIYVALL